MLLVNADQAVVTDQIVSDKGKETIAANLAYWRGGNSAKCLVSGAALRDHGLERAVHFLGNALHGAGAYANFASDFKDALAGA
jgi:hypothetical protein